MCCRDLFSFIFICCSVPGRVPGKRLKAVVVLSQIMVVDKWLSCELLENARYTIPPTAVAILLPRHTGLPRRY